MYGNAGIGSFDHLVGGGEQRWRHIEAQSLCRLEIDHQLELYGLLYRQVGWLCTPENSTGVDASQAISIAEAGSVAHQAAGRGSFAPWIGGRDRVACRKCNDLLSVAKNERITCNDEC